MSPKNKRKRKKEYKLKSNTNNFKNTGHNNNTYLNSKRNAVIEMTENIEKIESTENIKKAEQIEKIGESGTSNLSCAESDTAQQNNTETSDISDIMSQREKNEISEIFINSLNDLTQKDIPDTELNDTAKKRQDMIIRNIMLVICASIFLFSGYNIVIKLFAYAEASEDHEAIRNLYYEDEEAEADVDSELSKLTKSRKNHASIQVLTKMEVGNAESQNSDISTELYEVSEGISIVDKIRYRMQKLLVVNPDTYGWITVSGTNIDYPVVQTSDNDFYLKYSFTKTLQPSGAIFCDFRNDINIMNNKNTIIYGHNMNDNTMFQALLRFRTRREMFDNSIIEMQTMDGVFRYEIFSVYRTDKYFPYITTYFKDDDEWVAFLNMIQEKSVYKRDIELTKNDKIITLSTCTNITNDGRFAVHARLIEAITE